MYPNLLALIFASFHKSQSGGAPQNMKHGLEKIAQ